MIPEKASGGLKAQAMTSFIRKSLCQSKSGNLCQITAIYVIEGIIGALIFGFVFYNSVIGAVPVASLIPFYVKKRVEIKDKKDKAKLLEEFKEGMNAVAVALRAGYSVENAFIEAGKEMAVMSGGKSKVCDFFNYIKGQLSVNKNIEDALAVFANESGVTDIISFSEVFTYAKQSGGNMVEIIHDTVNTITLKADTAREISVLISAKQLEQIIMDIVPIGIILYLRITADELISKMYGNMYGITVMTVCLIVYVCAVIISMKISDIKV